MAEAYLLLLASIFAAIMNPLGLRLLLKIGGSVPVSVKRLMVKLKFYKTHTLN